MNSLRAEQAQAPDFQAELADITDRPLTAETIDTYAESALEDLAGLIQRVADSYPANSYVSGKDLEDAAGAYFGLDQIDAILDHLSDKTEEIRHLDEIIAHADNTGQVITPTDASGHIEPGANNGFEKKKVVPKLKTLLFILANEFDVDLDDRSQLVIAKGTVGDDMVRRASYYLVEIPAIKRTVLVCDEVGNATFVFDDDILRENAIGPDQLIGLAKNELTSLMKRSPSAGQRLAYTANFVPNIISALAEPGAPASSDRARGDGLGRYLHPKAPDGVLSLSALAKALGFGGISVLKNAIEDLGSDLGSTTTYKFYSRTVEGYTPEQQELIRKYLEGKGYYETIPEGFLNQNGLAQSLDTHDTVIRRAVSRLGEELGETRSFKSQRGITPYYSPEQQEMIRAALEASGLFEEEAPEGFLSVGGIAKAYGVGRSALVSAIGKLGEDLGEPSSYRFGGEAAPAYSLEQQSMIFSQMELDGLLAEEAPEGVLSMSKMESSGKFGVGAAALKTAVAALGEELDEVSMYRFGPRVALGYTPEQQELILNYLRDNGYSTNAPEGHMHAVEIAEELGVQAHLIYKTAERLSDDLGEVRSYKGERGRTIYYSSDQQKLIREALASAGLLDNDAPDGYMPIRGIANTIKVAHQTVSKSVEELGGALGETQSYNFKGKVITGYSPHQQELIMQHTIARMVNTKRNTSD